MAKKAKFTKTEFRLALEGSDGHIGVIASKLKVTRRTVYRYFDKYPELKDTLQEERRSGRDEIVELAQTALVSGILSGNERMIMFALRHYDKDGVPGAVDMSSIFAEDVVQYLRAQGKSVSDVVSEFESIVRMQAQKVNGDG